MKNRNFTPCKTFLFLLLIGFSFTSKANCEVDTITLLFPFNESNLTSKAEDKLDSLLFFEKLTPDKELQIIGYADYVGTNGYNDSLSKKRALAVHKYLLSMGFSESNIHLCIGKGEISRPGYHCADGYAPDRKVHIVCNKRNTVTKQAADKSQPKEQITASVSTVPVSMPAPAKKPTVVYVNKSNNVLVKPAAVISNLNDISQFKPDQTILLNKIYFPAGRHFATDGSRRQMDQLFNVLVDNPQLKIRIEGHVCCVYLFTDAYDEDTQSYNLSVNRARFIYDYLVQRGINANRLDFQGFGRSRPIVKVEHTEEEAQKNRRVEIRILNQ